MSNNFIILGTDSDGHLVAMNTNNAGDNANANVITLPDGYTVDGYCENAVEFQQGLMEVTGIDLSNNDYSSEEAPAQMQSTDIELIDESATSLTSDSEQNAAVLCCSFGAAIFNGDLATFMPIDTPTNILSKDALQQNANHATQTSSTNTQMYNGNIVFQSGEQSLLAKQDIAYNGTQDRYKAKNRNDQEEQQVDHHSEQVLTADQLATVANSESETANDAGANPEGDFSEAEAPLTTNFEAISDRLSDILGDNITENNTNDATDDIDNTTNASTEDHPFGDSMNDPMTSSLPPQPITLSDLYTSAGVESSVSFTNHSSLNPNIQYSFGLTQMNGSALPSWMIFDNNTGTMSYDPSLSSVGTHSFNFIASVNGTGMYSGNFNVDISDPSSGNDGYDGHEHNQFATVTDTVYLFDGNDVFFVDNELDATIYGGGGSDNIKGNDGNDHLYGGAGVDILHGYSGMDTLYGGSSNDTLTGGDDNDTLYGGSGNDILKGERGDDTLYGGEGDDNLKGGDGTDILYGEAGNDILTFDNSDIDGTSLAYDGGDGFDTLSITSANSTLDLTSIDNAVFKDIEAIDLNLTDDDDADLTLDIQDVLDFSSSTDTLFISGDGSGEDTMVTALGGWTGGAIQTINGNDYYAYTGTMGSDTATLYVDTDINNITIA